MRNSHLPAWASAAALASLPLQTPQRLRQLIDVGDPTETWARIVSGNDVVVHVPDEVQRAWACASPQSPYDMYEKCQRHSIEVTYRGAIEYPGALSGDPFAPAVLFSRGSLSHLVHRRVGIIGTRHPTRSGARMAFRLGAALAAENIAVVSGLARGIDVEAHTGVMSLPHKTVPPVAVVASGLDVVYPAEHKKIWEEIAHMGLIVSEAPPGTEPTPYRFPLRNRIIAALSEVLVVVESGHKGGSMITVREAMKRDVTVMAVPGSPDVRQSEGTTALLRDGCAPVGDVADILVALGLDTRRRQGWCDTREIPTNEEKYILQAMGSTPRSMDELALTVALPVIDVAIMLGRLEAKQWVSHTDGWWEALLN
jgi:DNA processing protein